MNQKVKDMCIRRDTIEGGWDEQGWLWTNLVVANRKYPVSGLILLKLELIVRIKGQPSPVVATLQKLQRSQLSHSFWKHDTSPPCCLQHPRPSPLFSVSSSRSRHSKPRDLVNQTFVQRHCLFQDNIVQQATTTQFLFYDRASNSIKEFP